MHSLLLYFNLLGASHPVQYVELVQFEQFLMTELHNVHVKLVGFSSF